MSKRKPSFADQFLECQRDILEAQSAIVMRITSRTPIEDMQRAQRKRLADEECEAAPCRLKPMKGTI